MTPTDSIEILTEDIIDRCPELAMDVLGMGTKLSMALGWHYLLDLIWILKHLEGPPPSRILDAGGGNGLLQYILACQGHTVISVDAFPRQTLPHARYCVPVLMSQCPTVKQTSYADHRKVECATTRGGLPWRASPAPGEIEYHQANLDDLLCLDSSEFDAVVSVSALEHNPPEAIPHIMQALRRVAKDGAPLLLTVSADRESGIHDQSHSWLLSEKDLARAYSAQPGYKSNFADIDMLWEHLRQSPRLRRWLGASYFAGTKNGMPSGHWAPQYLPVGLLLWNRPNKELEASRNEHEQRRENMTAMSMPSVSKAQTPPCEPAYMQTLIDAAARLHGQEVYFWGCGELYQRHKGLFTKSRPRCILVDGHVSHSPIDGLEVTPPDAILPASDVIPIIIFAQDVNKIYASIRSHYPQFTDIVFCCSL